MDGRGQDSKLEIRQVSDVSGHYTARLLVYTHRWLGIASGILFIVWFASGIVMMYARMPELDPNERLAHLPGIQHASIQLLPPAPANAEITRLSVTTLEGRSIFRVTAQGKTQLWFAD